MDIGYEILRLHRQAGKLGKQITLCQAQIDRCLAMLGKHPPRHSSPGRKQEESIEEKQSITI